jgi:DNA-binding LacI/PurR family transcriptional regulator
MARTTITDVAHLAEVSETTVSRALRNFDNVSPTTRQRVLDAAQSLHFTLSRSASSLASGKTMRVRLLVSGKLNQWFNSSVLQGAYEVLSPLGYDITPSFITNNADLSHFLDSLPGESNADAIIVASFTTNDAMRGAFASLGIPIVGINNPSNEEFDASARIDDRAAEEKAVRLLHSLGHTHLAFVGNVLTPDLSYSSNQRAEGFLASALDLGYSRNDLTLHPSTPLNEPKITNDTVRSIVSSVLTAPAMPTGICVEEDQLAVAVLNELKRLDIAVPQRISVVGFDDSVLAEATGLTSIHQDPTELGRTAAQLCAALMNGEQVSEPYRTIDTSLVLRNTTGYAPGR